MKWDINILKEDVQPELEKAQDYAEKANEILSEIEIPEGFYYTNLSGGECYYAILMDLESAEESMERKIVDLMVAEMQNNKIANAYLNGILKHMTLDEYKQELWYQLYGKEELYETAREMAAEMSPDEFFMMFGPNFYTNGNFETEYGINQGVLWENYFSYSNGTKQTFDGYGRLLITIMERYKMSEKDAATLIECIDTQGVCSYADVAQQIMYEFKDKPEEFEEIFGMPMYRTNENGSGIKLNGEEFLIDLYLHANTRVWSYPQVGDPLIKEDNGKFSIDYGEIYYDNSGRPAVEDQFTLSYGFPWGWNYFADGIIEDYIYPKTSKYRLDTDTITEYDDKELSKQEKQDVKNIIENYIENDVGVSLHVDASPTSPIKVNLENVGDWEITESHAMTVTDITNDEVIVSTWGYRAHIKFEDLKNNNCSFMKFDLKPRSETKPEDGLLEFWLDNSSINYDPDNPPIA